VQAITFNDKRKGHRAAAVPFFCKFVPGALDGAGAADAKNTLVGTEVITGLQD
jgi:hypothetical protein